MFEKRLSYREGDNLNISDIDTFYDSFLKLFQLKKTEDAFLSFNSEVLNLFEPPLQLILNEMKLGMNRLIFSVIHTWHRIISELFTRCSMDRHSIQLLLFERVCEHSFSKNLMTASLFSISKVKSRPIAMAKNESENSFDESCWKDYLVNLLSYKQDVNGVKSGVKRSSVALSRRKLMDCPSFLNFIISESKKKSFYDKLLSLDGWDFELLNPRLNFLDDDIQYTTYFVDLFIQFLHKTLENVSSSFCIDDFFVSQSEYFIGPVLDRSFLESSLKNYYFGVIEPRFFTLKEIAFMAESESMDFSLDSKIPFVDSISTLKTWMMVLCKENDAYEVFKRYIWNPKTSSYKMKLCLDMMLVFNQKGLDFIGRKLLKESGSVVYFRWLAKHCSNCLESWVDRKLLKLSFLSKMSVDGIPMNELVKSRPDLIDFWVRQSQMSVNKLKPVILNSIYDRHPSILIGWIESKFLAPKVLLKIKNDQDEILFHKWALQYPFVLDRCIQDPEIHLTFKHLLKCSIPNSSSRNVTTLECLIEQSPSIIFNWIKVGFVSPISLGMIRDSHSYTVLHMIAIRSPFLLDAWIRSEDIDCTVKNLAIFRTSLMSLSDDYLEQTFQTQSLSSSPSVSSYLRGGDSVLHFLAKSDPSIILGWINDGYIHDELLELTLNFSRISVKMMMVL